MVRSISAFWAAATAVLALSVSTAAFMAMRPLLQPSRAKLGTGNRHTTLTVSAAPTQSRDTAYVTADETKLSGKASVKWLEGNSWHWSVGGVRLLVDPIFSTLDFGIPMLYSADKKVFSDYDVSAQKL
jgi:Beta-lactamase superfamily domain